MNTSSPMQVTPLEPAAYPWDLLLLADPSKEQIEKYIGSSHVLGLVEESKTIGVAVLLPRTDQIVEIMNIAIAKSHQGRGLGKHLLNECISECRRRGFTRVEIATGNSSLQQLGLYQKAGFRIVGVDTDFFVRNYSEPIFENGIHCRDLVRMSQVL